MVTVSLDIVREGMTNGLSSEENARLTDEGWIISSAQIGERRYLIFEHPLSMRFELQLPSEDRERGPAIERFLARDEFSAIRKRPAEMEHAAFIGKLRELAGAMKCPPEIFVAFVRAMAAHRLLGEDESEWLEEAGAAWS